MKKILFIITLLLFIPLATQAKVYEHPVYNFSFEYSDAWNDITGKVRKTLQIPFYLSIGSFVKTNNPVTSNNKDVFSYIVFLAEYKKLSYSTVKDLTTKEQQQLIDKFKDDFSSQANDCHFSSSEISTLNDIPYIIIKFNSTDYSLNGWYVYFVKNNLQHSIIFIAQNSTSYFESEWLQILDSYTKNL